MRHPGYAAPPNRKSRRPNNQVCDQSLTLADAHGLVIINERRISACWSTDRHLGLTGAKLVTSSASA